MPILKRKVYAHSAPSPTSSDVKLTEKDLVPIAEFARYIKTGALSSGLKPWLQSNPNFLSDYYEARLQQAIPFFFNSGKEAQGRAYAHGSSPFPPVASCPPSSCPLSSCPLSSSLIINLLSFHPFKFIPSAAFTIFKSLRAHGVDNFIRKLGASASPLTSALLFCFKTPQFFRH